MIHKSVFIPGFVYFFPSTVQAMKAQYSLTNIYENGSERRRRRLWGEIYEYKQAEVKAALLFIEALLSRIYEVKFIRKLKKSQNFSQMHRDSQITIDMQIKKTIDKQMLFALQM